MMQTLKKKTKLPDLIKFDGLHEKLCQEKNRNNFY